MKYQPDLHQEKIQAAEVENQRSRKRAYRQLEADERQVVHLKDVIHLFAGI